MYVLHKFTISCLFYIFVFHLLYCMTLFLDTSCVCIWLHLHSFTLHLQSTMCLYLINGWYLCFAFLLPGKGSIAIEFEHILWKYQVQDDLSVFINWFEWTEYKSNQISILFNQKYPFINGGFSTLYFETIFPLLNQNIPANWPLETTSEC